MTERVISARTLALIAEHAPLRRLRIAYRADSEIYRDLLTITLIAACADTSNLEVHRPATAASELTTQEAAMVVGVTASAITEAIRFGRLPAMKRAGRWFIAAEDVVAYRHRREAA